MSELDYYVPSEDTAYGRTTRPHGAVAPPLNPDTLDMDRVRAGLTPAQRAQMDSGITLGQRLSDPNYRQLAADAQQAQATLTRTKIAAVVFRDRADDLPAKRAAFLAANTEAAERAQVQLDAARAALLGQTTPADGPEAA